MTSNNYSTLCCRRLAFVFCIFSSAAGSAYEPLPGLPASVRGVKNLSLPLGNSGGKPILKFLCGHASVERRSVGFLKIGVLPQLVLDDVELMIMDSPHPSLWAEEVRAFFLASPQLAAASVEKIAIRVASATDCFVTAPKARFDRTAQSLILESPKVRCFAGNNFVDAQGVIHLHGPNAGRLSLSSVAGRSISISNEGIVLHQN